MKIEQQLLKNYQNLYRAVNIYITARAEYADGEILDLLWRKVEERIKSQREFVFNQLEGYIPQSRLKHASPVSEDYINITGQKYFYQLTNPFAGHNTSAYEILSNGTSAEIIAHANNEMVAIDIVNALNEWIKNR